MTRQTYEQAGWRVHQVASIPNQPTFPDSGTHTSTHGSIAGPRGAWPPVRRRGEARHSRGCAPGRSRIAARTAAAVAFLALAGPGSAGGRAMIRKAKDSKRPSRKSAAKKATTIRKPSGKGANLLNRGKMIAGAMKSRNISKRVTPAQQKIQAECPRVIKNQIIPAKSTPPIKTVSSHFLILSRMKKAGQSGQWLHL